MGLIAGVLEGMGISTVCLSTFDAIMSQVAPPRRLTVPYPLGFPLGKPADPELQRAILLRALDLLDEEGPGPLNLNYDPEEAANADIPS